MRRAGEIFAIALALALLTIIAFYSNRPAEQQISVPSMTDTGRRGIAAWSMVLRREGFDVRAFTAHLTELDARDTTLVLAGSPFDIISQPTTGEMRALAQWVRGGGHVVLVGFAAPRSDEQLLGIPKITVLSKVVTHSATVTPDVRFGFPVKRLRGDFNAYYRAAKHHRVLARSSLGILAERHALGKGDVVAIADTELFDNATLAKADNARFAVALVGTHRVLFDEAVYGLSGDRRFWDVLGTPMRTAVILAGLLALLAIAGNVFPFVPPLLPPQTAARTSSGYIESLAQLLAAGGARTHAIATFAESALQRMRGRSVADGIRTRMNELSELAQRRSASDADVVRAGELYATIRKDVK